MATVFGISGFKSKLDDWRGNRKPAQPKELPVADSGNNNLRVVGDTDGGYDLSILLENLVIPKLIADRDKGNNWLHMPGLSQGSQEPRERAIAAHPPRHDSDRGARPAVSGLCRTAAAGWGGRQGRAYAPCGPGI